MWLLEFTVRNAIEQAVKSGFVPSAEQQAKFDAKFGLDGLESRHSVEDNRLLSVAGNSAEIEIKGVITKAPSFMAMLFGGGNTTYPDIISALAIADQDPNITDITLAIDSPGGQFDGLFDTLAAIQSVKKPVTAVIHSVGASAAFAIATQADKVLASNVASRIGSVGVVATFEVNENEVSITSTNAPNKRPDLTTEEGKSVVREELDAMHDIFVDAIATGRNTTVKKVNAEFGQGGTLLANEALKRGMIDGLVGETTALPAVNIDSTTTAPKGGDNSETGPMDLATLKASHPGVYAAAVQEGVDTERDRVSAHLIMGENSGDIKTAIKAVTEGSAMTETLRATYITAGMNRQDTETRQDDDAAAAAAADSASNADASEEQDAAAGDAILKSAAASCGVEVEA